MESEKKPHETFNIKNTASSLHDEGVDIVDDERLEGETHDQKPVPAAAAHDPVPDPVVPVQPETQPQQKRDMQGEINQILGKGPSSNEVKAASSVKNDPSIKPLRTFKTDAEEAIRYQNISAAQIAVAEQKKKEQEQMRKSAGSTPIEYVDDKKSSSGLLIAVILLFIVALIGGGGYYYWFVLKPLQPRAPEQNVPAELKVSTIIPYDKIGTVGLSQRGNPLVEVAGSLNVAPIHIGEVYVAIPVPYGTTTKAASPTEIFSSSRIPPMLSRSLAPTYMIGTRLYSANSPFIILRTTFFQNAYAGMLEWEKDMKNDLMPFIRVTHPDEALSGTSTEPWSDSVTSNIDTRILRGPSGQPILAYAFADRETIVISTSMETLSFVLDNLLAVRIVQ